MPKLSHSSSTSSRDRSSTLRGLERDGFSTRVSDHFPSELISDHEASSPRTLSLHSALMASTRRAQATRQGRFARNLYRRPDYSDNQSGSPSAITDQPRSDITVDTLNQRQRCLSGVYDRSSRLEDILGEVLEMRSIYLASTTPCTSDSATSTTDESTPGLSETLPTTTVKSQKNNPLCDDDTLRQ